MANLDAQQPPVAEVRPSELAVHPAPSEKKQEEKAANSSVLLLDSSKLDAVGRAFFDQWNVVFTGNLPTSLKK